jgi:hypothetical protein
MHKFCLDVKKELLVVYEQFPQHKVDWGAKYTNL